MFWGLIVEPKKRYTQTVEKAFHLSMASLDAATAGNALVQVMLVYENRNYLICTLQKGSVWQVPLDLNFDEGLKISFMTNGEGHVHLTGYLIPENDVEDFSYDNEEEEEESDKEEDDSINSKKRAASDYLLKKLNKKMKPAQQIEGVEDDDTESSDEDDDEDLEGDLGDDSDEDMDMDDSDEEEEDEDDEDEEDEEDEDEEEVEEPVAVNNKQKKKEQKQINGKAQNEVKSKNNKQMNGNADNKQTDKKQKLKGEQEKTQEKAQEKSKPQQQKARTLEGGVQVVDTKVGTGPVAKSGKMVTVYYVGRLKKSGKKFDSSTQGEGFKFRLGKNEVIKGWDVGLPGMKVGGKRTLTIPANMAYGSKGSSGVIPPNATLTFEIELKAVN